MADPLAYFITWTTYGTWLPGDDRGWVEGGVAGIQAPEALKREEATAKLTAVPVVLSASQRATVERWQLHAVDARSNHVHVIVTADRTPEEVMNQFKAWCSRRLNEESGESGKRWWTKHGLTKWINDDDYFQNALRYVVEGQ